MSEIKVPEAMLDAACNNGYAKGWERREIAGILEAALRWWSENPIVPTKEQANFIPKDVGAFTTFQGWVIEFQRRMFLAPEPVKDLADRAIESAPCYGLTPTHAELDKLWEHYFLAGHKWVPPSYRKEK